jgi:MoxR-vWA-beta-propeller ternary system domain bpX0/MoxR-vWA-beta-propeller ternary system domain bpX1
MMNIKDYLQSTQDYFWQWEDNFEVAVIVHGNTIAYRPQILEALEALAPLGLPRFGSLLLAFVATNPNADASLSDIYKKFGKVEDDKGNKVEMLHIEFLKQLALFPPEFKTGKKRLMLFQHIFKNSHNHLSLKDSASIVEEYRRLGFKENGDQRQAFSVFFFSMDCRPLAILNLKYRDGFTIDKLLENLPEIPEEVLPISEKIEVEKRTLDFVDMLTQEPKTFSVGALIRQIWSGLNIPLHHAVPSPQPMGGVSDLTNKGNFDRLLITEFANDDLVFLSRLANNEALYYNREIPPESNKSQRIILVDVSIKTWGTPRTVAYALMLAIARHPKTDIECTAYAVGQTFRPIGLGSVTETINGLQILEACLHPEEGLQSFMKSFAGQKNMEVFFISNKDTMQLDAMQKCLSENRAFFDYWLQTDVEGRITVFKKQSNGQKHVQEFVLPLEKLWAKKPMKVPKTKVSLTNFAPNEPQPLQQFFPILFPTPCKSNTFFPLADGTLILASSTKQLFSQHENQPHYFKKGWKFLYHITSVAFELGQLSNGENILLLFSRKHKTITLLNINTGLEQGIAFPEWRENTNFLFFEDQFHIYIRGKIHSISVQPKLSIFVNNGVSIETFLEADKQRKEVLLKYKYYGYMSYSLLQKIKFVGVTSNKRLVFNHHELVLTARNEIMLIKQQDTSKIAISAKKRQDFYLFSDDYFIEFNHASMLILHNNTNQTKVFIPAALDMSLGVATASVFAGNTIYHLNEGYQKTINTVDFWQQFIVPFVEGVVSTQ